MFILPIVTTFIVFVVLIWVEATDYRVYSRDLRLDRLGLLGAIGILASGIISLMVYIGGLR